EPTYSRMRSSPLVSGITLSTMRTSKLLSVNKRCAWRGVVVLTTSCPSSRSARLRVLRIFSSSSTRRIEPRGVVISLVEVFRCRRRPRVPLESAWRRTKGQVDPDLGAPARLARDRNRAAKPLHDVLGDGKTKPGAAAL